MLGIGFPELVVILVLLLVLFKPEQLVDVVRVAGSLAERLRRAGQEIRDQVEGELHAATWERPRDVRDDASEHAPVKPSPLALAPPRLDDDTQPAPHRETDGG